MKISSQSDGIGFGYEIASDCAILSKRIKSHWFISHFYSVQTATYCMRSNENNCAKSLRFVCKQVNISNLCSHFMRVIMSILCESFNLFSIFIYLFDTHTHTRTLPLSHSQRVNISTALKSKHAWMNQFIIPIGILTVKQICFMNRIVCICIFLFAWAYCFFFHFADFVSWPIWRSMRPYKCVRIHP